MHLDAGGSVIIFPSGENSLKKQLSDTYPMDPDWKMMVASLIRQKPDTKILPVFVDGSSSEGYHRIKRLRPQFVSDFFVPMFHMREIAHNIDSTFKLAFGTPYSGTELLQLFQGKLPNLMEYIRAETHLLRGRLEKNSPAKLEQEQIISPISKELLFSEYSKMTLLFSQNKINVYIAKGEEIPHLLNELGRIREKVFRTVHEGTGKSQDNDKYDIYYHHVVAVDAENGSVLGAYRLGLVDQIIKQQGPQALYNTTLFDFIELLKSEFYYAIELGRSIVDPEAGPKYKRALDSIWKGIAVFLSQNPQYTKLIGPVSMSSSYTDISKQLIVRYFLTHHLSRLANQVIPKIPFNFNSEVKPEIIQVVDALSDVKQLHRLIKDIEGEGLPPLFMSYGKLGAKYLSFNVDPPFNSLDGLIVVDLHQAPKEELLKQFGNEETMNQYLLGIKR